MDATLRRRPTGTVLKILLAYIAVTGGPKTYDYCARFVGSYLANPPQYDHELVVCCNGGPLPLPTAVLFHIMPSVQFYPRQNDPGMDLTAYQDVAARFKCDMLVCCGETIHFHRPGWIKRYVESWEQYGPGMFGTFSSNLVRPHLNTTGFCIAPKLLLGAPRPQNKRERYSWEHGQYAAWTNIRKMGYATRLVTFDGCYDVPQWRYPDQIMWRGDQSNCLMFCSHTDRFFEASPEMKIKWANGADKI